VVVVVVVAVVAGAVALTALTRAKTDLHNTLLLAVFANATRVSAASAPHQIHHEFRPTGRFPVPVSAPVPAPRAAPSAATSTTTNAIKLPTAPSATLTPAEAETPADSPKKLARKGRPPRKPRSRPSRLLTLQSLDEASRQSILNVKDYAKRPKPLAPARYSNPLDSFDLPDTLTPEIQARLQTLQTCRQAASLPSLDTLRSRMQVIGSLNGVDIDPDCGTYMEQALSTYLKDIISSVQARVRQPDLAESSASAANHASLLGKVSTAPAINKSSSAMMVDPGLLEMTGEGACAKLEVGKELDGRTAKTSMLSTDELLLSSEITPVLLKRSAGSTDVMEMLLASV
ncbi:hypothetical protein BC830DRAFT_1172651, partial [Chytriomyces sp. MP71]